MTEYHTENVCFEAGDTHLAGDLWLPAGPSPFPAVIMVHGSGPAERGDAEPKIREQLAGHGIASLAWDKPGLGDSSGDWERQRIITDRAEEVRAAIQFLQGRPNIDPTKIGLWGISQGGWIVPLVAATTSGVAFIIPVSAPGISVEDQILYDYQNRLRAGGLPDDQVEEFGEFLQAAFEAARAGVSFEQLDAEVIERCRDRPWYAAVAAELTPQAWEHLVVGEAPDLRYHLKPVLGRVTCPVLAIFGEDDVLLPVATSVILFEETLSRSGNTDVTVTVFPGADHGIGIQDPPGYAPGYLELLSDWVLARTR